MRKNSRGVAVLLPPNIVWSHATNSRAALDVALSGESDVNFVEADIVQPPGEAAEAIMA